MYHYPLTVCGKFNCSRKISVLLMIAACGAATMMIFQTMLNIFGESGRPVSSNWSYLPVRLYGWYECDVFMGDAGPTLRLRICVRMQALLLRGDLMGAKTKRR